MLTFLCATYNEQTEINDLIGRVYNYVDGFAICDDGSTDATPNLLKGWQAVSEKPFAYKLIEHTGLPETVKAEALKLVPDDSWVLMLDCDERLDQSTFAAIEIFTKMDTPLNYVYFKQNEYLDDIHVRTFQKCKLFRKEAVRFPLENIHADDEFSGLGTYNDDWVVHHRKTTEKQKLRETEYLGTYAKLLESGKIDEGRYNWLKGLHHFVFETKVDRTNGS